MRHVVKALVILLLVGLTASLMGQISPSERVIPARAEAPTITPTPQVNSRRMTVPVTFTWYDWWMVRWENNEVICRILIEHEGQPTSPEIQYACGNRLFAEWRMTKPCDLSNLVFCRGMYMHFVRSFPGKRNTEVVLPQPKVWVSLVNCNPAPTVNRCTNIPSLMLTGEELLSSEMMIRIQGTFGGEPFSCPGETCLLPLRPTGTQGVELEFWGDSSFGDSSEHYKALLRVIAQGDLMVPDGEKGDVGEWYVDVLSPQWREGALASCSDTWQVFPDIGGPPAWLNTPVELEDMLSTRSYYYLAGKLITNGEVNPEGCPDGGLIGSMIANQCGLEKALPQVIDWQNRFDTEILKVSQDTGVPAQLLKNIFGRESQFWPGLYKDINEAGLGQMTEKGADTLLMWNINFYQNFCPLILSGETCQNGYVFLKPGEQDLLRGALVSKVNAACPTCPVGIDLAQAEFSVRIFAESLLANCSQTSRVVTNVTNKAPGQVSSFVDLWKFTLVNYNAGTGCLWSAMSASYKAGERLNWKNVSARLDDVCKEAVNYVDVISGGQPVIPTPTAWVFGGTPLPPPVFPTAPRYTPTPQPTATITPTSIASATPTGPAPAATRSSPTPTATQSTGNATPTATQVPSRTPTAAGYPGPGPESSATPPSYP